MFKSIFPIGPLRRAFAIPPTGKNFIEKIVSMANPVIQNDIRNALSVAWNDRKFKEIAGSEYVQLIDEQLQLRTLLQQELNRIPLDPQTNGQQLQGASRKIVGADEGPIQNFFYVYVFANYVKGKLSGKFNEEQLLYLKNNILKNYTSYNPQIDLLTRFKQEYVAGLIETSINEIKDRIARITTSGQQRISSMNNIFTNFAMILFNGAASDTSAKLPIPKAFHITISQNPEISLLIQRAIDVYDFLTPELKNAFAEDIASEWPNRIKIRGRLRTAREMLDIIAQPCFRVNVESSKQEMPKLMESRQRQIEAGADIIEADNSFRNGTTKSWARDIVNGLDSENRETIINEQGIMTGSTTFRGLLKWGRPPCNAKLQQSSYNTSDEHTKQLVDEINTKYQLPSLAKSSRVLEQPPNTGYQALPNIPLPQIPPVNQSGFGRRKTKRKNKNKNKRKTRSRR